MKQEIDDMSNSLLNKEFSGDSLEFTDEDIAKLCLALGTALNSRIWALNEDTRTKLGMTKKVSQELKELTLKWSDVDYHEVTKRLR